MKIEIRTNNGSGKKLFEWNPENNTISLINKNMYYRVQLYQEAYRILEEHPKKKDTDTEGCN